MKPLAAIAAIAALLAGCLKPGPAPAPHVAPPDIARSGAAPARALAPNGGAYAVVAGDTLSEIARRHGVPFAALSRANGLAAPYVIHPGQRLLIPVAGAAAVQETPPPARARISTAALPPPPAPEVRRAVAKPVPPPRPDEPRIEPRMETVASAPAAPPPRARRRTAPEPEERTETAFLWPVEGPVLAAFGPREGVGRNDGINIGAALGAPVRAAENGVVVYAGNELRGYGNLLLIRHAGDWTSAYAHNHELLVERGAAVRRGQTIARVGRTGGVGEPQSHFELRKGADAVDPLKYLAPR